jgi:malonyl CoA-acyl carrier protein transacylase/acyl carrier protein
MSQQKVALLFPGQGACYPGVLRQAVDVFPEAARVFADVDAVAQKRLARTMSDAIWSDAATIQDLVARHPDVVQLAIYATSVAVYRLLESEGLRPDVLMGHSFGEIAAIVCGGAFSVTDGAEIVCDRTEACRLAMGDGYMAALGSNASAASALVTLLGNHDLVVAAENSETQTIVSGLRAKMDRAEEIARILNIGFFRLNSPYPFHSPLMEPVRAEFDRRLQRFSARPLQVPVYSPIIGRYYEPADRLTDFLASHLVRPVAFAPAVRALYADGVRVLVECGALNALTKLAASAWQTPDLTSITCLARNVDETDALRSAITTLRRIGKVGATIEASSIPVVPTGLTASDEAPFWAECGASIRMFVDQEYAKFRERQSPFRHQPPDAEAASRIGRTSKPAEPIQVVLAGAKTRSATSVMRDIVSMYAEALEYPEDVFTPEIELEAELGIDSVKQTELLARVSEKYALPSQPADFRLSDYNTIGKVVDFVIRAGGAASEAVTPAVPGTAEEETRESVFRAIVATYAAALEYPEDVFTADVELEAELGIDSVKQTELLARLSERYSLPPRPADFRLADYNTLGKVAEFVFSAMPTGVSAGGVR